MESDINELWVEVLEGSTEAWKELVRRHSALVYTVARRTGLDRFDAEDCAQHTWLMLYRHRRKLKNPRGLPAWLIRTCHRQAIYVSRQLTRRAEAYRLLDSSPSENLTNSEIERLEWQAALNTAMTELDPRCCRLIEDLFLAPEDVTYKIMAERLGLSINALGPLRSRCLKKLQSILKKMGYEPHYM